MTSKEFILSSMKEFLECFRNVRIRYQFDELDDTHFVEIVPQEVRNSDEFCEWESDMIEKFGDAYPAEGICFLSEKSAVEIESAEWTLYGEAYAITSQTTAASNIELKSIRQMPERFVVFSSVATPVMNVVQNFNLKGGITTVSGGNDYQLAA